ncbi:uncharacterized [Tachysurus ichikawai]
MCERLELCAVTDFRRVLRAARVRASGLIVHKRPKERARRRERIRKRNKGEGHGDSRIHKHARKPGEQLGETTRNSGRRFASLLLSSSLPPFSSSPLRSGWEATKRTKP